MKEKPAINKPVSFLLPVLFSFVVFSCASINIPVFGTRTSDMMEISALGAIGGVDDASGPLYSGNGGQDIRLAVLAPESYGDVPAYLPLYVQGLLNTNFKRFSAINLVDRQNLDTIIAEQDIAASGRYSDDDYVSIGNLINARYFLVGTIQKISGDRYSLQFSISDSSTGIRNAAFMKDGTLSQLEGTGTLINEATAELLEQMGVTLTETGKRILLTGNSSAVKAEAGLARGITAQTGGSDVEALFNYTQSIVFNPSQIETLARLNLVSSSISEGTISERIVNDIQARDQWIEVFKETTRFYNDHPPFEIIFDPNLVQIGETDFVRRTANLGMRIALDPSRAGFDTLNALLEGLESTGRRGAWGFSGWPLLDISPRTSGTTVFEGKRTFSYKVDVELLNQANKTLGKRTITFTTKSIEFSSGSVRILPPDEITEMLYFSNIKAEDLTPILTIVIVAVNGVPSGDLNASGYMRIETGNLENRRTEAEKTAMANAARQAQRDQDAAAQRLQREQVAAAQQVQSEQEAAAQRRQSEQSAARFKAAWNSYIRNAHKSGWEALAANYIWGDDRDESKGFTITSNVYGSLFPFSSIGLGAKLVFFVKDDPRASSPDAELTDMFAISYSFSPSVGLVVPFNASAKVFADAVLELGYFGDHKGTYMDWVTPGFDVGLLFRLGGANLSVKYAGTWFERFVTNSVGLGLYIN
jgi:hypothetical protein